MRRTARPASEVDLARPVIAWLEGLGYSVSQEVDVGGIGRADIVGEMGPKLLVVECKLRLSWELMIQASRWTKYAHLVAVAVPFTRGPERDLSRKVISCIGVGLIEVAGHRCELVVDPIPNPNPNAYEITSRLRPEHKTSAPAGSSRGGHHTEFKGTTARLVAYVREHPGEALRDIVDAVPHHYVSKIAAIASLEKMIRRGVIQGLRIERRHGRSYLYPAEAVA